MSLASTILRRSLALRCPRCGEGRLFPGLLRTAPSCASCGLATHSEQGFFVGAIYLNYGATTLLGLFLTLVVLRSLPPAPLVAAAAVYCLAFPTWFFRYSRSLWLGLHHYRALREGGPDRAGPFRGSPS